VVTCLDLAPLIGGAALAATAARRFAGRFVQANPEAVTAGVISRTRTITLAWVLLGDHITPLADLFLATGKIAA